jgi:hypothetical protein
VRQTTAAIAFLVVFSSAVGIAGDVYGVASYKMFYGFMAFALAYLLLMRLCWIHGRFPGRNVTTGWYTAE